MDGGGSGLFSLWDRRNFLLKFLWKKKSQLLFTMIKRRFHHIQIQQGEETKRSFWRSKMESQCPDVCWEITLSNAPHSSSSSLNAATNTHECWAPALTSCFLPFSFFPLGRRELDDSASSGMAYCQQQHSQDLSPVFVVYLFLYSPFHTCIASPPSIGSHSSVLIDNLLFPGVLVEGCFECMQF